jgi:hypothetical protein
MHNCSKPLKTFIPLRAICAIVIAVEYYGSTPSASIKATFLSETTKFGIWDRSTKIVKEF